MNSKNKKEYGITNGEQEKQKYAKLGFENLKSNFILKKIFDHLKKIKLLKIMKFSKKSQKKIIIKY